MSVTAVVVAADDHYLEATLGALRAQRVQAERIIVLDVRGGAGAPDARLSAPAGEGTGMEWHPVPGARTFARALTMGLQQAEAVSTEWMWLLHDDSPPDPHALAELLKVTAPARAVGIAGCKQVDYDDDARLISVGVAYTRAGRRVTVEPGEIDQGQYDDREDVYGVGTAGMLIRTSTWEKLGGLNPALGPFLDGAELSRRARLAGERVIVVPAAKVRHARAGLWHGNLRQHARPSAENSFLARRRATLYYRLITAHLLALPLVAAAMFVAAPLRALWRLAANDLGLAGAELLAPLTACRAGEVYRGRRAIARAATRGRGVLAPLTATRMDVLRLWWHRWRAQRVERRRRVAPSELEIAEKRALTVRRRWAFAGVALALLAGAAILVPRALGGGAFSIPALVGGALGGVDQPYGVLWERALAGWVPAGDGAPGPHHPFGVVLATLATLVGGPLGVAPHVAVTVVLLGAIPAAGVGAWFAAGAVTRSVLLRAWAALAWAAAPVLATGLNHGRVAAVLAHALLPFFALALARTFGVERRDVIRSGLEDVGEGTALIRAHSRPSGVPSSGAGAAAGLLLAAITAAAPVLLPALVALTLLTALFLRRGRARLLLVLIPTVVLATPYLVHAARLGGWGALASVDPAPVFLTEFTPEPGALAAVPWHALSGWAHSPHAALVAAIATAVLVAAALVGLLRGGHPGRAARWGWVAAGAGVLTVVLSQQVLRAPQYDWLGSLQRVPEWAGTGASLAVGGMILAAMAAPMGAHGYLSSRGVGVGHAGVAVLAVALAGLVAAAGVNAGALLREEPQWHVREAEPLPAIARQTLAGPDASRVLVLGPTEGAVSAAIWRANGPQLLDPPWRPMPGDPAREDLREVAAALTAGTASGAAQRLADHGVGFVLVPGLDSPYVAPDDFAREELVAALDGLGDLERVTDSDSRTLWRVVGTTSRVRVIDGETATALPSGPLAVDAPLPAAGGQLVLAERADPRWRATLNGTSLRAIDTGWYQAFDLPAGASGQVRVEYEQFAHRLWRGAVVVVFGLSVILALPVRRRGEVAS